MTMLPLPRGSAADRRLTGASKLVDHASKANRGLVFNKFVDRWGWKKDPRTLENLEYGLFNGESAPLKKDWLSCFAGSGNKAGNKMSLNRANVQTDTIARRSVRMRYQRDAAVDEVPRDFLATSRFATGLGLPHPVENGFLWHHTLGVPYLPGSSVKGMIRAWATCWRCEEKVLVTRLFGNETNETAQMGSLIVFDALPLAPVELAVEVLTPHDGGWRLKGAVSTDPNDPGSPKLSPADWHSPVPVFYLAVEAGTALRFALGATRNANAATDDQRSDVALGYELLEEALEWIGAGAKTAVGLGRFQKEDDLSGEQLSQLQGARSLLSPGMRVRVSETVAKASWRGVEATVVKTGPNALWGVVKGEWDGKSQPHAYFAETDLKILEQS